MAEFEMSGRQPGVCSYNSAMVAHTKRGDMDGAMNWFNKMHAAGVSPNVVSFNILVDAAAKAENVAAAEAWFHKMAEAKVSPNTVSYSTLIHVCIKTDNVERAEEWLQKMTDSSVEPNIVCYNSFIYACSRKGDVAGAEKWLQAAEAQGLSARVQTYSAMIDACAKAGDVQRAETWMQRMIDSGIEPNVFSYSSLIDCCAKAGDAVSAFKWFNAMTKANVQPNAHSFCTLINACAKVRDVDRAMLYLESMEEAGVRPDVIAYSGVLDACAKRGDVARAQAVLALMRQRGVQPNTICCTSIARAFVKQNLWQEVERLTEMMKAEGIWINEYFLTTQLLAYRQLPAKAEAAFRTAQDEGVIANQHVCDALVRAVGRQRAKQLLSNKVAIETFLYQYAFASDWRTYQAVLGLLGLWWCFAALWVEVRLEKVYPGFDYANPEDPDMKAYKPFCDFAPWANCSQVLMSPPGRFLRYFGIAIEGSGKKDLSSVERLRQLIDVPNPTLGVLFFACHLFYPALLLIPIPFLPWLFFLACCFVGGMTIWLAYNLFFVLKDFCVVCVSMYVANFALIPMMYALSVENKRFSDFTPFFGQVPDALLYPLLALDAIMGIAVVGLYWSTGAHAREPSEYLKLDEA